MINVFDVPCVACGASTWSTTILRGGSTKCMDDHGDPTHEYIPNLSTHPVTQKDILRSLQGTYWANERKEWLELLLKYGNGKVCDDYD